LIVFGFLFPLKAGFSWLFIFRNMTAGNRDLIADYGGEIISSGLQIEKKRKKNQK
jgi:hypothetical protein